MTRLLLALLTTLLCAALLPADTAFAQAGTKAYAPEDLRRLSVPDRIRVIEKEYAEQSRGRQIPDDQLEFYLDQIGSGWTFSRVKQDIAESLRGSAWRPSTPGWQARELICSSERNRYAECAAPFRGPAVLSQQISNAACVEGHSWGQRRGTIWVDKGCRARFREDQHWGGGGYPGSSTANSVVCESREGKLRRCANNFRFEAELAEQFSNAPCIRGQTWGSRAGEIWVSRGCRARFIEGRGFGGGLPGAGSGHGSGYSVTCSSDDNRPRTCAWADRGRPYLLEQLSRSACVEGRTWGFDGRSLWVNQGCRGRFGSR